MPIPAQCHKTSDLEDKFFEDRLRAETGGGGWHDLLQDLRRSKKGY